MWFKIWFTTRGGRLLFLVLSLASYLTISFIFQKKAPICTKVVSHDLEKNLLWHCLCSVAVTCFKNSSSIYISQYHIGNCDGQNWLQMLGLSWILTPTTSFFAIRLPWNGFLNLQKFFIFGGRWKQWVKARAMCFVLDEGEWRHAGKNTLKIYQAKYRMEMEQLAMSVIPAHSLIYPLTSKYILVITC